MHTCASIFLCTGAYAVGAEVLIKDYERKKRKGGKLDYRWLGPYKIEKSLGKGLYMLKEAKEAGRVIDRVHGTRLKPYLQPLSPNVSCRTLMYSLYILYACRYIYYICTAAFNYFYIVHACM